MMVKQQLYEPFSISVETLDDFPKRTRQNAFFELVYVLSGKGKHCINNSKLEYQTGELYLLSPKDRHCFDIESTSSFFFLRFNDIYLKTNGSFKEHFTKLEAVLQNANQRPGPIIKNETDKPLVRTIVEGIIQEQVNRDVCWEKLTQQFMNTLIVIVGRNIEKFLPEKLDDDREDKAFGILQYIQANIYYPAKIKAENVSKEFGISITYLGRYFKKHTGKTMQDYVSNYKTKLIEHRLLNSTMRISEIVDELGFSDESHLNKFFRKHNGINPSEYRRRHENIIAN
jgi:AraC-like DNA-binding protein